MSNAVPDEYVKLRNSGCTNALTKNVDSINQTTKVLLFYDENKNLIIHSTDSKFENLFGNRKSSCSLDELFGTETTNDSKINLKKLVQKGNCS